MAGSSLLKATISDGTTDMSFSIVSESFDKITEKSLRTSSAGRLKGQTSGYRIAIDAKIRMTPVEYNELKILLVNGSLEYYYTPLNATIHDFFNNVEIPIKCQIDEVVKDFDNVRINHVNLEIRSSNLFIC